MRITILAVTEPETVPSANGRSYQTIEVLYRDEQGKRESKKLVSFNNPGVFKMLQGAKQNDTYEVKLVKTERNGKSYWNWASAEPVGSGEGESDTATLAVPSAATVRELAATRAPKAVTITESDRQRLIVRQSCLQRATEYANYCGEKVDVKGICAVAAQFEKWVFRTEDEPEAAEPVEKKKPGRPRKVVTVEPAPSEHNVDLLDDEDDELE